MNIEKFRELLSGTDDLTEETRQRLEEWAEEESTGSEGDLLADLIPEDSPLSGKINSLADLKALLPSLIEKDGKFKDMEKGFTQKAQRVAALEKRLQGMGIGDVEAFLKGEGSQPKDRKSRIKAVLRKYKADEKYDPFYEELLESAGSDEESRNTALMALSLATKIAHSHWLGDLKRDEKYKDLDDETAEALLKIVQEDGTSLSEFLKKRTNPLHKAYAVHFANKNPDLLNSMIDKKAKERKEEESSKFTEPSEVKIPPAEKTGEGETVADMEKELSKAGFKINE